MNTPSLSQLWRRTARPNCQRASVAAMVAMFLWATPATAQSLSQIGVNPYLGAAPVRGTATAYDPVNNVYLVVGSTAGNNITPLFGVFANAAGLPLGGPFEIKDGGEHSHFPRVTYSPDVSNGAGGFGGFLVTWHGGLFNLSVRTRVVAYPTGVVSAQSAIQSSSWQEAGPSSAYSTTSKVFLVTWQQGNFSIWGSLVGLNGAPIGNPINISALLSGGARDPSVAWNAATNEFGVLYTGFGGSSATTTFAIVTAGGAVTTRNVFNFAPATYITDLTYNSATGRFVGVWSQGATYGAEFAANGSVVGQVRLVSTTTGTYDGLSVYYNPFSGTCLLVGQGPTYNVWGAELNGAGVRTSIDVQLTSTNQPSFYPRATAKTNGPDWNIAFYSDNGQTGRMLDQIVRTSTQGTGSTVSVSPTNPAFSVLKSGPAIGGVSQTVSVTFSGAGGTWSAVSTVPWLQVTNGSGSGNGQFSTAIINPNDVIGAQKSLSGSIVLTAQGAPNSPVTIPVTLTVLSPDGVYLDGGNTGDVFAYSASTGGWGRMLAQSGGGFLNSPGGWSPNWTVVPARFNADILTDFLLFNTSTWEWAKVQNNGTGFTTTGTGLWWPGWQRFVMDLDGDGFSDVFLYDPVSGVWFKGISTPTGFDYEQGAWNPGWEIYPMRLNGDFRGDMFIIERTTGHWIWVTGKPGGSFNYSGEGYWFPSWILTPGDYNGDGLTDLVLHDPAAGIHFVATTTASGFTYVQGTILPGWKLIPADLNGDGADDVLLHNPTTGRWQQAISDRQGHWYSGGGSYWTLGFDVYPTDFNGDGRADFLLYNPTTGLWFQAFNHVLGSFSYTFGYWDTGLTLIVRAPNK